MLFNSLPWILKVTCEVQANKKGLAALFICDAVDGQAQGPSPHARGRAMQSRREPIQPLPLRDAPAPIRLRPAVMKAIRPQPMPPARIHSTSFNAVSKRSAGGI